MEIGKRKETGNKADMEISMEHKVENEMEIRKSTFDDMEDILHIFHIAREYMASHGNETQWGKEHPKVDMVKKDIREGNSYVIEKGREIIGTFTLIFGKDPTYQIIKNGSWHDKKDYATIHRLASKGTVKGVARACFLYATDVIDYVRIDTHENNLTMQAAIEKFGFEKCGNIYLENGSERIAYDYRKIK